MLHLASHIEHYGFWNSLSPLIVCIAAILCIVEYKIMHIHLISGVKSDYKTAVKWISFQRDWTFTRQVTYSCFLSDSFFYGVKRCITIPLSYYKGYGKVRWIASNMKRAEYFFIELTQQFIWNQLLTIVLLSQFFLIFFSLDFNCKIIIPMLFEFVDTEDRPEENE